MSFTLGATLFRYIRKEYKKDNRGVFVEAFVEARGKPLSVNLISLESNETLPGTMQKPSKGEGIVVLQYLPSSCQNIIRPPKRLA